VAAGFCAALAESVTDPAVDDPGVGLGLGLGVATAKELVDGAESVVGGAESVVGGAESVVGGAEEAAGGTEDMTGGADPEPWAACQARLWAAGVAVRTGLERPLSATL
jgi:hypothetical protein